MKFKISFVLILLCILIPSVSAAGGSGTAGDPYIISNAIELQAMNTDLAAYYSLDNNIDLNGITWTPIGNVSTPFIGSFDGNDYTISHLVENSASANYGLFGVCSSGAQITNVILDDCSITTIQDSIGILVGYVIMSSSVHDIMLVKDITVQNCEISSDGSDTGGVIGEIFNYGYVELENILVTNLNINGQWIRKGGVIGRISEYSNANFVNCDVINSNFDMPIGFAYGGLIGNIDYDSSVIIDENCSFTSSDIKSSDPTSSYGYGGYIGTVRWNSSVIINGNGNTCITDCNIIVDNGQDVGGIIGSVIYNTSVIINDVKINKTIIATDTSGAINTGGFIGDIITINTVNITSCEIEESVIKGGANVGGISASSIVNATDCNVNISTIYALNEYAGGIMGKSDASVYDIHNCNVKLSCIKGAEYVSGILGGYV